MILLYFSITSRLEVCFHAFIFLFWAYYTMSPPKIYFQRIPVHASDSHVGVFYPLQIVQISPTLLREQVSNLD